MATTTPAASAYAAREEVVVRLAHVRVFNTETGAPMHASCVPAWTIGEVIGELHGSSAYLLRLTLHEAACLCVAPGDAIDGTA